MKHVCQTVLPNVYILVHSWTADQEFKCSLFLISQYYSHCMLCPKPVTPFGHESQQCFHLTGSKETQVLSTCNSRLHSQWFLPAFFILIICKSSCRAVQTPHIQGEHLPQDNEGPHLGTSVLEKWLKCACQSSSTPWPFTRFIWQQLPPDFPALGNPRHTICLSSIPRHQNCPRF